MFSEAVFTARTTGVSNPFCAPSLHPSLSDPYSQSAFAIVSPTKINNFTATSVVLFASSGL